MIAVDLSRLTIHEAHDLLQRGQLTSLALTQALLDRILAVDNDLQAYLTILPEMALEMAANADQRRAQGEDHPLLGIPLAVSYTHLTLPTTHHG